MNNMKIIITIFFILFLSSNIEALDLQTAINAAKAFEKKVFSSAPDSKSIIKFLDVSRKDGHLIAHLKPKSITASTKNLNVFLTQLLKAWREEGFVKTNKKAGYLSILVLDPISNKDRTYMTLR